MRARVRVPRLISALRPVLRDERGFTLLEVMIAIVLMMVGLLAAAGSFPRLMAMSVYGKDQTRGSNLAQQQMEVYRNTATSTLGTSVGDYGTVPSQYFDQDGNGATQSAAYFTRDVQIQYWPWSASTNAFVLPASPYTAPAGAYMFHVSVTTHWLVRGQTVFTSGNTTSPNGCVTGGSAVTVGLGCITVSTFVAP